MNIDNQLIVIKTPKNNKFLAVIDIDKALEYNEIVNENRPLSRSEAIAKLKESKDLFELGLLSEKEYNQIKKKLTPIIVEQ